MKNQINLQLYPKKKRKVAYPHKNVLKFVKERTPFIGSRLGENLSHIKKLTMIVFMKVIQDIYKQNLEELIYPPVKIELYKNGEEWVGTTD